MESNEYAKRYASGEWRTPIFFDLIAEDIARLRTNPHFLDIGCGTGFDEDLNFQIKLAELCSRMVGVEPAEDVPIAAHFDEVHRCLFEDAPIDPNTIDLAWAVMVLEHVKNPVAFFERLHTVLRDGGVFWGFTVDSRHYFAKFSKLIEVMGLKSIYLKQLHTSMEAPEFRHYPAFYSCNCPSDLLTAASPFRKVEFLNFNKPGQVSSYLPTALRPMFFMFDRWLIRRGKPGALLAVRMVK